jgi:hypothetical protein
MKVSAAKKRKNNPIDSDVVEDVLTLPGEAIDDVLSEDGTKGETPFRGYEDLKHQYFGPTIFNKQRLYEAGDSLLYQTAYAAPGALTGYLIGEGDLKTTLFGLGVGKLLGQGYALNKEQKKLNDALESFNPIEKNLLKHITNKSRKWALGGALLGGLGVGGLSYLANRDMYGSTATPLIEGAGGAIFAALAGNLLGDYFAKQEARKNRQFKAVLDKYDNFS